MIAETLSVGTELLLGQIVDTNAAVIAQTLPACGVELYRRGTVGDNPERIRVEINAALSRADILITIGGLGPTMDDLTKEIACQALDVPLVEDPEIRAKLDQFAKQRAMGACQALAAPLARNPEATTKLDQSAKHKTVFPAPSFFKQALVPASGYGQPIPNPNGTAPGVIIENNNKVIICFPGPPNELIPMLNNYVVPFLAKRAGESAAVILSKTLRLTGIGESQAEETVKDLLLSDNPSVAPLAKPGECWLRITAKAQTKELAQSLIAPKEAALRERLGDYVYGVDNENLEYAVVELAKRKKAWIATAESCTGGLLAHRITTIPGASDIFATGIVAYANETKSALADVRPETIQKYGAVSEETAREMAIGVKNRYGAQIGLSTTGIAGPGGGTESKPVGLVYVGIAKPNGSVHVEGHVLTGSRTHVMVRASQTALTFARLALLELPDA